jgi:hypothetical protein
MDTTKTVLKISRASPRKRSPMFCKVWRQNTEWSASKLLEDLELSVAVQFKKMFVQIFY